MKVVVIGMGDVGKHIAMVLAGEKHDVIIIDENPVSLAKAEETMDVLALRGHGASIRTLREAKVEGADLVIAVSNRDEINMLAALTAKQLGAGRTVARISEREYLDEREGGLYHELLGIDLVLNVQILAANEIHRLIKSVGAIAVENFVENQVEMIQLPVDEELSILRKPLRDIQMPRNCLVAGILRNEELIIPSGVDALLAGDEVFLIGTIENIPKLEKMFGKSRRRTAQKVVILGGGDVGLSVAKLLEHDRIEVVLIESDSQRCVTLSNTLNRSTVINGDGRDLALLREENMNNCDVFVAVSTDDETNLMSSLLAKTLGARKTVVRVNRPDYGSLFEHLGIDATVSPRLFAANQILKYIRPGEVVSVSLLEEGKAEILEIVPSEGSRITGRPLKAVSFPRGAMVAAVAGKDGAYVPKGDDVISPGEMVVVFTTPAVRPAVERLFRKKVFSFT